MANASYPSILGASIQLDELGIVGAAEGDIIYFDGTDWVLLPKGTNGQILELVANVPLWTSNRSIVVLNSQKLAAETNIITYTPASALNLTDTYSEIIVIIKGTVKTSTVVKMSLNGHTTYNMAGMRNTAGTLTGFITTGGTFDILNSAILSGVDNFYAIVRIALNHDAGALVLESFGGAPNKGMRWSSGKDETAATTITSIRVDGDVVNFKVGTEMITMGIKR